MAEDQVLVEFHPALAVEVDVEELSVVEHLLDRGHEVQTGHLLMAELRVQSEQLRTLQRIDERKRMTNGGEHDVPAWLIRLRLDRKANAIALVRHVLREQVHSLAVALQRRSDVFGGVVLSAVAPAPHHERLGAELDAELELTDRLAQREAPNAAVVGGEAPGLERRRREEVGGHHRHLDAVRRQRAFQPLDLAISVRVGGAERE